MPKRPADQGAQCASSSKKTRLTRADLLSSLSDELLLRVFSNLSVYNLTVCQRVSQRFHTIAGDSHLWKAAYYDRFVRPRASRVPKRNLTQPSAPTPSKLSRWLNEDILIKRGTATNWKRQYKIRHKWSNGTCRIRDITLPSPPIPPVLARLYEGVVYTADSTEGLRAWAYKDDQILLATEPLQAVSSVNEASVKPTSLAVDSSGRDQSLQLLLIGFSNGAFSIYYYHTIGKTFGHIYSHPSSSNGRLYALAFSWPFVLSISANQTLSVYKFGSSRFNMSTPVTSLVDPKLLASLKSNSSWTPLNLSLRVRPSRILAAIAYCTPTYVSGWTTGIQEIHMTPEGEILDTRLASADSHRSLRKPGDLAAESLAASLPSGSHHSSSKPTSLSYSHPYLLAGHSDNTLTLYMVTSNTTSLSIGAGKRLWGHTSSVFEAHVGSRGRAVSVSTRGDEIRIWELERNVLPGGCRAASAHSPLSVQVMPESRTPRALSRLGIVPAALAPGSCAEQHAASPGDDLEITRAWVGFDEENVVVLREHGQGQQRFAIYDFDY